MFQVSPEGVPPVRNRFGLPPARPSAPYVPPVYVFCSTMPRNRSVTPYVLPVVPCTDVVTTTSEPPSGIVWQLTELPGPVQGRSQRSPLSEPATLVHLLFAQTLEA